MGKISHLRQVMLRFQVFGTTTKRIFKLVAAYRGSPRNGKFIERLGSTAVHPDPNEFTKYVTLKPDRINYFLSQGAECTEPVKKLLGRAGILPPHPRTVAAHVCKAKVDQGVDPTLEKMKKLIPPLERLIRYREAVHEAEQRKAQASIDRFEDPELSQEVAFYTLNHHGYAFPIDALPQGDEIRKEAARHGFRLEKHEELPKYPQWKKLRDRRRAKRAAAENESTQ